MSIPPKKSRREDGPTVRTTCERCGAALEADLRDAGKKATCPQCGSGIIIPDHDTRSVPARRPSPGARGRPAAGERRRRTDQPAEPPGAPTAPAGAAAGPVSGETPAEKLPAAPTIVTTETHKMRAKLAGWLRRVVIVVLALAVVKVFEAAFASLIVKAPANLHGAVYGFFEALRAIPGSLRLLAVERPVEVGQILPAERFLLGVGMLIYATRLVVRSKLLDAVYVTSARWKERTSAGLVAHFLMMLVIAGLLAWAASATKVPSVSDGLACGLIAVMLWVSAFWLMTLHLVAGNEYPELTRWMFTDAVIGVLVFIVALWPGLTILWSRAGATAVLLFVDSAVALHVGASFVFARRPIRWWWHKPLTIIISAVLIFLIAVLLACVR